MTETIAVVGSTGRLGRHVTALLQADGHRVLALSKSGGVDVLDGEALAASLEGASVVIDVSTGRAADQAAAEVFFTTATGNLQHAASMVGAIRIVTVAIIGADRFTLGYNAATHAHERAALAGPVPARVLRAAQFHEFVPQLAEWGRHGDGVYTPGMRTQLVGARSAAERLVELALDPDPSLDGTVHEVAGPQVERLADAVRLWTELSGSAAEVVEVEDPNDPDHLYTAGGLLPGPGATLIGPSFAEWATAVHRDPAELAAIRGRLDSARADG